MIEENKKLQQDESKTRKRIEGIIKDIECLETDLHKVLYLILLALGTPTEDDIYRILQSIVTNHTTEEAV